MPLNRVLLLVTARDRARAAQMAEPLRVGAERALKALNIDGAESHVLMPIAGSQGPSGEHGRVVPDSLSNGVKLGGFDAAVEVTVAAGQPLSALVGCLEEVRESAGHVLDLARSAAVAGTDVVILEGDAPNSPRVRHEAEAGHDSSRFLPVLGDSIHISHPVHSRSRGLLPASRRSACLAAGRPGRRSGPPRPRWRGPALVPVCG